MGGIWENRTQWMFTACVTSKLRDKEDIHEMKFMDNIDTLHFCVAGYFSESCFTLEKGRPAWHRLQSQTAGLGISAFTPWASVFSSVQWAQDDP